MNNEKPAIQRHRSSSAVAIVTDAATTSQQHKVSLTKGIWNPEIMKGINPQHGYYFDTSQQGNIHTHKPISPSRRFASPSARSAEKFQALTKYILTSNQMQTDSRDLQSGTNLSYATTRKPLIIDFDANLTAEKSTLPANTEALIASGFRPDKLVNVLSSKKEKLSSQQHVNTRIPSTRKLQSDMALAQESTFKQQRHSTRAVTRGKSPMARPYVSPMQRSSIRRGSEQKPLGSIQQQRIIIQFPMLLEIIPLFPASTVLYFITEEAQSSFSDTLQRTSALRNIAYLRLYDALPLRNCTGIEDCTDYLSVQSKSTNAHIPISPWRSYVQRQKGGILNSGYSSNPAKKLSPHLSRLTDDVTTSICKSNNKQTTAFLAATKIIDELSTASVTSGTLPECLTSLIDTCLLAIQEDNILCDPTESAEDLKMDADIAIRTIATMISKNLIGVIKRLLAESMSYTCGKTVVERQLLDSQRKVVLNSTNSSINRYLSSTYTILNQLQSLANVSMELTTELLELTIASKRPRTFAFLIHACSIICLVGPGLKDAFFTGQFMGQLGDFVGRLLVDRLTFTQVNASSMLHVSLAVLCRLNYSFGFVLLPYTTQALHTVVTDLIKMSVTTTTPQSPRSKNSSGYISNPLQHTTNMYHKVTANNTAAIHAISKYVPQTDEERSVQLEYIEDLKAQGTTQQTAWSQGGLTIYSLASLLYLHASTLHAVLSLVTSSISASTHCAVANKALHCTISIVGRILQWISSISLDTQRAIYGKGPNLSASVIYELRTLLLPNLYTEDWNLGLSKFELQFFNIEKLTNLFLARLLNQARKALLITDQDMRTITLGLIRDSDAIHLLSSTLKAEQTNIPPHASAATTRCESEMGADGVREVDEIGPGVSLTGNYTIPLLRDTYSKDHTYDLEDRDSEKLADYFEDDSCDIPIDDGFI